MKIASRSNSEDNIEDVHMTEDEEIIEKLGQKLNENMEIKPLQKFSNIIEEEQRDNEEISFNNIRDEIESIEQSDSKFSNNEGKF